MGLIYSLQSMKAHNASLQTVTFEVLWILGLVKGSARAQVKPGPSWCVGPNK